VWAGVFEEVTCRGVLYLSLRRRFGVLFSAALSAAVFGGLHFYSAFGFVCVSVFGFVQALAVERTRSLLPAILAHAATNFFLLLGDVAALAWE